MDIMESVNGQGTFNALEMYTDTNDNPVVIYREHKSKLPKPN